MKEQIPLKLAVLISNKGTGTNLGAIIDAIERGEINCQIGLVVSDRPDALGLERAKKHQLPWEVRRLKSYRDLNQRDEYGRALAERLNQEQIRVAVLAGFMTVLSHPYFETFQGKTLNIHPGLIPDEKDKPWHFPDGTEAPWNRGLMTETAVANFLGGRYAGSTIHIATEETDFGPVLERVLEDVRPDDTVETLYGRLKLREHEGLIRSLARLSENR